MAYEFNTNEEILLRKVSNKGIIIAVLIFIPSVIDLGVILLRFNEITSKNSIVFSIQDILQIGIAIAFLLPLTNIGNIIKTQGNDINELMKVMQKMIIGFKIIIACLVLTVIVESIGAIL